MLGGRPKLPPVSTALDSQRDRAVRKVRETFISSLIHPCTVYRSVAQQFSGKRLQVASQTPSAKPSTFPIFIAVFSSVTSILELNTSECVERRPGLGWSPYPPNERRHSLAHKRYLPKIALNSRWIAAQAGPSWVRPWFAYPQRSCCGAISSQRRRAESSNHRGRRSCPLFHPRGSRLSLTLLTPSQAAAMSLPRMAASMSLSSAPWTARGFCFCMACRCLACPVPTPQSLSPPRAIE